MTGHLQGGRAAADFSLSRKREVKRAGTRNPSQSEFGFGNKHRILHYSWSGDPLLPTLKSNLTLCCASVCVWVGISWDWSGMHCSMRPVEWPGDQQPQVPVSDKMERRSPFSSGLGLCFFEILWEAVPGPSLHDSLQTDLECGPPSVWSVGI